MKIMNHRDEEMYVMRHGIVQKVLSTWLAFLLVFIMAFMAWGNTAVMAKEEETSGASKDTSQKVTQTTTTQGTSKENAQKSTKETVQQDTANETTQQKETKETAVQQTNETAQQDTSQETASEGPDITSPAAILMEASTGQIIYEKNVDEQLHPASITKIMTLILIFDALSEGKINLSDDVVVSEHAASMGGSQVYLEPNETQTVDTMIKCISMASANDACVSMAEYIDGTEEAFVAHMNERAKELGMENTTFVNCCGLDVDGHMSSAKDVALMSRELINKYPQIHNYSTVWMDTITHVTKKGETEFGLTNTNKLVKQYEWATGLKTGSTGLAKCCLAATAEKDGINLIAVIMAAPNSKTRFSDAITLLNFGFSKCDIYHDENMPELAPVAVNNGQKDTVPCEYKNEFSYMFMDHIDTADIKSEIEMYSNVAAPVAKGDVVGQLCYYYKGEAIGYVDICAAEDMKEATYGDSLLKMLNRLLFKDAA